MKWTVYTANVLATFKRYTKLLINIAPSTIKPIKILALKGYGCVAKFGFLPVVANCFWIVWNVFIFGLCYCGLGVCHCVHFSQFFEFSENIDFLRPIAVSYESDLIWMWIFRWLFCWESYLRPHSHSNLIAWSVVSYLFSFLMRFICNCKNISVIYKSIDFYEQFERHLNV